MPLGLLAALVADGPVYEGENKENAGQNTDGNAGLRNRVISPAVVGARGRDARRRGRVGCRRLRIDGSQAGRVGRDGQTRISAVAVEATM